jgi:hypothetical protein
MSKSIRLLIIFLAVFAVSFGYRFFMSYREARNNPVTLRKAMASAGKTSCVKQAQLKAAGTATTPTQIDDYCDCTITRGFASFSDAEILAAADRGANISAADRAKMMAASQTCNVQVFSQH